MREKVGKSRNIVFSEWFVAPEGRKVGSLKRRVRSQLARWEMKNCTPLWRSTFSSQNVQNTSASDHFWKLRCRKSARRCGAKHMSKSKCTTHTIVGPLLQVEMSKKCTALWREAHFEVKMLKTHKNTRGSDTFGGSDVASRGRRKGLCNLSKVSKTCGFCSIFNYNHNYTTLHSNTLHSIRLNYTTLHYTTLRSTTLHCITLHYNIPLHYITLHYITLHYTTVLYTSLHYTTLHSTTLQLHNYTPTTLDYTPLHSTTLNYTPLHCYTQLHYTTLHYTTLHYTTLHYTTLPSTTPHYITLHYTPLTLHYTTLHYTTLPSTTLHYITLHYNYNYTPLH